MRSVAKFVSNKRTRRTKIFSSRDSQNCFHKLMTKSNKGEKNRSWAGKNLITEFLRSPSAFEYFLPFFCYECLRHYLWTTSFFSMLFRNMPINLSFVFFLHATAFCTMSVFPPFSTAFPPINNINFLEINVCCVVTQCMFRSLCIRNKFIYP
jgi:hypothetical protein